jgi:hypothetical protein
MSYRRLGFFTIDMALRLERLMRYTMNASINTIIIMATTTKTPAALLPVRLEMSVANLL